MKTVLSIESRKISYQIPIESKYTIIRGDSGIGKTTLINMLRQPAVKKVCGYQTMLLPPDVGSYIKNMTEYLDGLSKEIVLLCGDEDLSYIKSKEFQQAMQKCKHLFLLVTRKKLAGVPYAISDVWELRLKGKTNIAKRVYERQNDVRWDEVSKVVTEDSKSGYGFFRSVFSGTKSADGKDNIPQMISRSQETLYIADGLGAGSIMQDIILALTDSPSNQVAMIGSFECMVYQSELINGQEAPTVECPNKEDFYTDMLSQAFAEKGLNYSKSKCSLCLTEDCCFKGEKCPLYKRGNKRQMVLSRSVLSGFMIFGSTKGANYFK